MLNCPSCNISVNSACKSCPHCGWQICTTSKPPSPTIVTAARRPRHQCDVDLAATVDRTGSSRKFQTGIAKTFGLIVDGIQPRVRSMKCWVQTHGDRDEGQFEELITDGGTPERAKEDIGQVTYGGGGPPEENHLDAIETLIRRVPWTADAVRSRGIVLCFMTAETKPSQSGITATELGQRIKGMGLLLYLVCERTPRLQELADAAGGLIFQISNEPNPHELEKTASQVGASIVATIANGSTVPIPVQATQVTPSSKVR